MGEKVKSKNPGTRYPHKKTTGSVAHPVVNPKNQMKTIFFSLCNKYTGLKKGRGKLFVGSRFNVVETRKFVGRQMKPGKPGSSRHRKTGLGEWYRQTGDYRHSQMKKPPEALRTRWLTPKNQMKTIFFSLTMVQIYTCSRAALFLIVGAAKTVGETGKIIVEA